MVIYANWDAHKLMGSQTYNKMLADDTAHYTADPTHLNEWIETNYHAFEIYALARAGKLDQLLDDFREDTREMYIEKYEDDGWEKVYLD